MSPPPASPKLGGGTGGWRPLGTPCPGTQVWGSATLHGWGHPSSRAPGRRGSPQRGHPGHLPGRARARSHRGSPALRPRKPITRRLYGSLLLPASPAAAPQCLARPRAGQGSPRGRVPGPPTPTRPPGLPGVPHPPPPGPSRPGDRLLPRAQGRSPLSPPQEPQVRGVQAAQGPLLLASHPSESGSTGPPCSSPSTGGAEPQP